MSHQVEARRLEPRASSSTAVFARLIGQVPETDVVRVARFVDSPDFEFLALQVVIASYAPGGERAEILSEVREELRQGLRQAVGLEPHELVGLTDALHDALIIGHRELVVSSGTGEVPDAAALAAVGHLAAMAARNGRLLSGLADLAATHELAELMRRQVGEVHGVLRLPHTGASRSVPWEQLYVEPALTTETTLARLVAPPRRTVILGDPGAGKSTLLRKLAHDVAMDRGRVPFLAVLRDIAPRLSAVDDRLVDHLARICRNPYNVDMPTETAEYLLLNGRAVVMLDGLDELTNIALRQRVVELIEGFVALYPLVPVIVTSRRIGYQSAPLSARLFESCEISPFDEARVGAYVVNWFNLDDAAQPDERGRLSEAFMRESESVEDLRSNPLLLALLCAMYSSEHYIPRRRAQIYERCATMLFETWDSMRDIPMPMHFQGQVRGAIQTLAWKMFSGEADTELSREKAIRLLANYLMEKRYSRETALTQARKFLDFCAGRAWVLSELGADVFEPLYGFTHRTFMEYFAAEHIVRRCENAEEIWAVLRPAVLTGQWDIVSQLVLQLFERNVDDGADKLINVALRDWGEIRRTERWGLAAFAANALAHVSPLPPTIMRIGEVAVDSMLELTERERSPVKVNNDARRAMEAADGPMSMLTKAFPSAVEYVNAGVASRMDEAIRQFDDVAHLFALTRKEPPWQDIIDSALRDNIDCLASWRRRHPRGLLQRCRKDPKMIPDTFARLGARPFYEYTLAGKHVLLPFTEMAMPARAAFLMAYALMAEPRPWVQPENTDFVPVRVGLDHGVVLGALIIIGLPQLERFGSGVFRDLDPRIAELVASHRDPKQRLRARNERLIEELELVEPFADFVLCWANGEFSVTHDSPLSLSGMEIAILGAAKRGDLVKLMPPHEGDVVAGVAFHARYVERIVALERRRKLLEESGDRHPVIPGRRYKLTADGENALREARR